VKKIKQPHGGAIVQAEKGETANPHGRPKKVFSHIIAEWKAAGYERATPTVVEEAYQYLLSLPISEVMKIAGQKDDPNNILPSMLRIAAKELLGNRGKEMLSEMLDRANGKSKQSHDLTSEGQRIEITPISFRPQTLDRDE
jgi:hypothetical protein